MGQSQSAITYALKQASLSARIGYHAAIRASTRATLRECNRDGVLMTESRKAFEAEARDRDRAIRDLGERKLALRVRRAIKGKDRDFGPAIGLILAFCPAIAMLVGLVASLVRALP